MAGNGLKRTAGLTLVELLVVIAIIGLLAAILLPVLISTRESARAAKCTSNLKQLYVAFELYASDWNGVLPCPGGLEGDRSYWAQECGGGVDAYLKNQDEGGRSIFCCPSYTGVYASPWSPRTYGMNSFLRSPPDDRFPNCLKRQCGIRKSNILEPSRTILLYEGMPESRTNTHGEGYVFRCGDWTLVRGYADLKHYQRSDKPWHRGRNNYLFCDGHVESLVPEKYPEFKGGPKSPETDLWHVDKERYHGK